MNVSKIKGTKFTRVQPTKKQKNIGNETIELVNAVKIFEYPVQRKFEEIKSHIEMSKIAFNNLQAQH